jgi:hypothetical protein
MPKVLIYRSALLPISETFIKEQILAHMRWQGVLIGMRTVNGLPLDGLDAHLLRPIAGGHTFRYATKNELRVTRIAPSLFASSTSLSVVA